MDTARLKFDRPGKREMYPAGGKKLKKEEMEEEIFTVHEQHLTVFKGCVLFCGDCYRRTEEEERVGESL